MKKGGSFLLEEQNLNELFTPEDFSEQHRMIAETTANFVSREVVPKINEIEAQNFQITLNLMRKAGELGLLSIDIPEEYGGLGLDKTSSMLVAENFGRVGSFAATHGDHTGIGTLPIVFFGTAEQKKQYLPKFATGELLSSYSLTEPNAGSDALSIRTTATLTPDGKHYIIHGTKNFLTNGGIADLYITFAKINGEHFTCFIIPKGLPGIALGAEEKKMGLKGSSTRTLILENVKIPAENLLGEIGKGHKIAFNILNMGRFKLGASAVGGAKEVITTAVRYAKERKQFGKSISEFGLIKEKLAEMAVRTFAAESMVYRTAGYIDEALSAINQKILELILKGIEEYAVECSIIKVFASETLDYVVDEGVQIFGGYGFIEEYPVARPYRDSRINRIFEGTNEINRLLIPGMLLKRAMKGELPLLPKAQKLLEEILGGTVEEESGGPFQEETTLLKHAKKILLFAAGLAIQKFMAKLEEEQEVLERMSDMVIEVYAMESVLCRVQKKTDSTSKDAEVYKSLAQVYLHEGITKIEKLAKEILAYVAEGDTLRTYLLALRKLLKTYLPMNIMTLRRIISDYLVSHERYAL